MDNSTVQAVIRAHLRNAEGALSHALSEACDAYGRDSEIAKEIRELHDSTYEMRALRDL